MLETIRQKLSIICSYFWNKQIKIKKSKFPLPYLVCYFFEWSFMFFHLKLFPLVFFLFFFCSVFSYFPGDTMSNLFGIAAFWKWNCYYFVLPFSRLCDLKLLSGGRSFFFFYFVVDFHNGVFIFVYKIRSRVGSI